MSKPLQGVSAGNLRCDRCGKKIPEGEIFDYVEKVGRIHHACNDPDYVAAMLELDEIIYAKPRPWEIRAGRSLPRGDDES